MEILRSLIYPDPYIILGFIALLLFDLVSGNRKAKNRGEATISRGLRKTVDKTVTYLTLILTLTVIANIIYIANNITGFHWVFGFTVTGAVVACAWIETISIFENLIDINTKDGKSNALCDNVLKPIRKILVLNFSFVKP